MRLRVRAKRSRGVGLDARRHHYPHQLSGGEQQRVALARAFVHGPELLFADEPTGNLDQRTGAAVSDLLFALNREHGTTLVLVTHDIALAGRCERSLRLADGRIDTNAAKATAKFAVAGSGTRWVRASRETADIRRAQPAPRISARRARNAVRRRWCSRSRRSPRSRRSRTASSARSSLRRRSLSAAISASHRAARCRASSQRKPTRVDSRRPSSRIFRASSSSATRAGSATCARQTPAFRCAACFRCAMRPAPNGPCRRRLAGIALCRP